MPKKNLLQMVQDVGAAISSDEITALGETVEAEDIQTIVLAQLEDLVTRQDWEFLKDKLSVLNDGTHSISLNIPDAVSNLQTVRYKCIDNSYRTLTYLDPLDYLHRMQQLKTTEPNSDTVVVNGVTLVAKTNQDPRFWTILNDDEVFVDAYDSSRDATGVVGSQSVILMTGYLDYTGNDQPTWIAPIPEKLFTLWLQECIAEAFVKLRQVEDPREERKARRQYVSQSRDEATFKRDEGSQRVNYGR